MGFHSGWLLDALPPPIFKMADNFTRNTLRMAHLVYASVFTSPSLASLMLSLGCLLIIMEVKAFNIEFGHQSGVALMCEAGYLVCLST